MNLGRSTVSVARSICVGGSGQTFTEFEKKLVRLALNPAARGNEVETSAIKLVRSLRARGVRPEAIMRGSELPAPTVRRRNPELERAAQVRFSNFGRHANQPLGQIDRNYLRWALRTVESLSHEQREAIKLLIAEGRP
jgi:hypothetical protein